MRKKTFRHGGGWNKDQSQGVKIHFLAEEITQISYWLIENQNWHDYALLNVALDSMLRSVDLLQLRVKDVCYSNGQVRRMVPIKQQKTGRPVKPEFTDETQAALVNWIQVSGKRRNEFLFTRTKKGRGATSITRKHLSTIVKSWAEWLGHPPDDYASHSLRRTKGVLMYRAGEPVADIAKAYGHASEASTLSYLGIDQERVGAMCRKYAMTPKVDFNRMRTQKTARKRVVKTKAAAKLKPEHFCPNAAKTRGKA